MIIKESVVRVIDNSGAKTAKCIGFWKGNSRVAGIGNTIVVSIQRCNTAVDRKRVTKSGERKVVRGEVCLAVVVQVRQPTRRSNGERVKYKDSAIVLVNEKGVPRGTRFSGVVSVNLNNLKLLSLASHIG